MFRVAKFCLLLTLFTLSHFSIQAQTEVDTLMTLEERYAEMLKRSENFKEYEVVRRSTLNMFWAAVNDSVTTSNAQLKEALVSKMELQSSLTQKEAALAEAQGQLALLRGEGVQVTVLGIKLSQSFYHALLWSLILAFACLMAFFLFRFYRGNVVVKETEEEHNSLQKQYDELRHRSKETQMKLKRELQTALNRLEGVERA